MSDMLSTPAQLIGEVFALILRGAPGYEAHLWPDATLALSGDAGAYWLNAGVIGSGPNAEERLRHVVVTLRERSLPGWVLHDDALTARLAPLTREAGLTDAGTVPFMVYRPNGALALPEPNGELQVERVTDAAGLREANRITALAFETAHDAVERVWGPLLLEAPGFDLFLGRQNGDAISLVMTLRQGPLTGIWTMGTLPERQRQGSGRQLLAAVIRHHLAQGTEAFYLAAFEAGKRLYEQTGFQTATELRVWIAVA